MVGFIGLGDIGAPMAMRILDAGHALCVFNRTAARTAPFVERGASAAATPADLARACDVILICVTDTASVEEVVFGASGLASASQAGHLVVDLSTIDPMATRAMAARLERLCGASWVDAPVSGGPSGARAGTLAVMAGGDEAQIDRARPVLMSFAGRVTRMGPLGCGMATKACNQMLNFGAAAVIAETLNFAANFGIDPAIIPEAVAGGFADSAVLRHFGKAMAEGTYSGNSLMAMKDIDIILDLGRSTGSAMPITGLVASMFRLLIAQGHTTGGLGAPMRLYAEGPLSVACTSAMSPLRAAICATSSTICEGWP